MENLRDFIKETLEEPEFEGCKYCRLDDKYYLVFAWLPGSDPDDTEMYLCGKIAYNCDDLQCDYDWDWLMPDSCGDVLDTELTDCANLPVDCIYDYFVDSLDNLQELLKKIVYKN